MRQTELLIKAAKRGRAAHAYLFSGNDREGKEEATTGLFQALVCAKQCEACRACRAIAERQHPDLAWVAPLEGKKSIGIDQIHELNSKLSLTPSEASGRYAVIDRAHLMTRDAQAALLKLLEEPPRGTVIVLRSEYSVSLLDTIQSRAQEISFYRFDTEEEGRSSYQKLSSAPLADRFSYNKEVAESPEKAAAVMYLWMKEARLRLLKAVRDGDQAEVERLSAQAELMQESLALMWQSQMSTRSLLDRAVMEL